jgi:hypothetical protein
MEFGWHRPPLFSPGSNALKGEKAVFSGIQCTEGIKIREATVWVQGCKHRAWGRGVVLRARCGREVVWVCKAGSGRPRAAGGGALLLLLYG